MDADLVAFATDPLSCPAGALPDTEVVLTLLAGQASLRSGRAHGAGKHIEPGLWGGRPAGPAAMVLSPAGRPRRRSAVMGQCCILEASCLRAMWSVQAPRSGRGLAVGEAKVLINCHVFGGQLGLSLSGSSSSGTAIAIQAAAAAAGSGGELFTLGVIPDGLPFNMHTHFGLALPGPLGDSIEAMPLHELAFYVAGCARETLLSGATTVRAWERAKARISRCGRRSRLGAARDRVFSRPGEHWSALVGMGMIFHQSHLNAMGSLGLCAVRGSRSALAPISSVTISGGIAGANETMETIPLTLDELEAVIVTAHNWGRK